MLQRIAEDIWSQETDLKIAPGARMPCRATIMRLSDGGLVVCSPLAIDDATAKELDALGDVRFLVAPSLQHWMFLKAAKERYPNARVFGPPGLEQKVGDLAFERLPERGRIDGMRDEIRIERIEGAPALQEHVLLHERSCSLVVADLMFNIQRCDSFLMRLALRCMGVWKKTAQSRAWRFLVKDRAAAAHSANSVLSMDFERIVVAHGDVIDCDPYERSRRALAWMTSVAPPLLGTGSAVA